MQSTIAQVIALTTHANAFVSGNLASGSAEFYPSNSTFAFCEYVRFVDLEPNDDRWREIDYSPDPVSWFRRLRESGASSVRMQYVPREPQKPGEHHVTDRMLVGFVGGGRRWLIEVITPRGSDFWESRWEVGDQNRSDKKIWRVTYGRIAKNRSSSRSEAADIETMKSHLSQNLSTIAAFAREHSLEGFAKAFAAGLAHLGSTEPLKGLYHADLAPSDVLPLEALQLLATAQTAWVFGGMGSWNDLVFDGEDQKTYDRLSEELYQLLNAAVVLAANAGEHPRSKP